MKSPDINKDLLGVDLNAIIKSSLQNNIVTEALDPEVKKAHQIVARFGDADMSVREIYDLLIHNGINNAIAKNIAQDIRGEELVSESYVAEPKQYKQVSELVSQKTKDAHRKLYEEHVESMNRVSSELDAADTTDVNSRHDNFRSLKLDETSNVNSVWLHELYFANCFDPHSEIYMDSLAYIKLQRDFGTFEDFQNEFVACAMAAGSGWVVCCYNIFLRRYVNTVITDNSSDVMVGMYPLIVVDMHEHSYYRDYLTDKKSYLIAQMREFNWSVINERFKRSEGIAQVLK